MGSNIETRAAEYFGWGSYPRTTIKIDRLKVLVITQGRLALYEEAGAGTSASGSMALLRDDQIPQLQRALERHNR
jgi:hypothetical protein